MAQRDERLYLSEILEAIDRVLGCKLTAGTRSWATWRTQDAVVRPGAAQAPPGSSPRIACTCSRSLGTSRSTAVHTSSRFSPK